jgi:large subunit ribosomal protein L30
MAAKKVKKGGAAATIQIKYYRSCISTPKKHKIIIKGLGFKRLNQIVTRVDTPAVRGMVLKIPHLVAIVDSK